ncbi:Clp protease N-terminal domain-containing protein [Amycolatopsis sp. NPDC003731]
MNRACDLARQFGHARVGSEHLLLALTEGPGGEHLRLALAEGARPGPGAPANTRCSGSRRGRRRNSPRVGRPDLPKVGRRDLPEVGRWDSPKVGRRNSPVRRRGSVMSSGPCAGLPRTAPARPPTGKRWPCSASTSGCCPVPSRTGLPPRSSCCRSEPGKAGGGAPGRCRRSAWTSKPPTARPCGWRSPAGNAGTASNTLPWRSSRCRRRPESGARPPRRRVPAAAAQPAVAGRRAGRVPIPVS